MKFNFEVVEDPWLYRLFWLVSVCLFMLPGWLGRLSPDWVKVDQWLVIPHIRFLLYISPPLAEHWPGPLTAHLTDAHRTLFSIFYGALGWMWVRVVCYQFKIWTPRIAWIFVYWLVCFGLVEMVIMLMAGFKIGVG